MNTINDIIESNLGEPICNIAQSMYDDFIRSNAEFRVDSGLNATITRETVGNCCAWCAGLEGEYDYGDEPDDVYHRHDNCRCTVTYKCDKGFQNVHTKKWLNDQEQIAFEQRKNIGRNKTYISPAQRIELASKALKN